MPADYVDGFRKNMSNELEREFSLRDLVIGAILGVPVIILGVTVILMGLAIVRNEVGRASGFSTIVSSSATLVLVIVTMYYAKSTRNLVLESQKDRKRKEERENRIRKMRASGLRESLIAEINVIDSYDRIREVNTYEQVEINQYGPMDIYENNSSNLYLLNNNEVEAVVEYYSELMSLEEFAERLRKRYERGDISLEELNDIEITESINDLVDARDEAVRVLEENLD